MCLVMVRISICEPRGLEVIKLEYILRLKIKHNDWLLADTCSQAANHCAFFFESENELKATGLACAIINSLNQCIDRLEHVITI